MAKWQPDTHYIASIYPGDLDAIALNHGPSPDRTKGRRTIYRLTPVPRAEARTKPCVIQVADAFEDVIDLFGGPKAKQPKPIDSAETVRNLLQYWTGNMVGVPSGASPGIIEIANTFPTKAEFERMFEMQTLYFEWGYQRGEQLHRENNWKEITGAMKLGALWLRREPIWANPAQVSEMVACPLCKGMIDPTASVCIHCSRTIRALPKELAALNQEEARVA